MFTVAWVLAFSAIIALAPQYYWVVALAFLAGIIGFVVARAVAESRRTAAQLREVPSRQPLLEIDEKEVRKAMERDQEGLAREQAEARRRAAKLMLAFPIVLLFAFLFPYVIALAGEDPLMRFLATAGFFALWILATWPIFGGFRPAFPIIATGAKVYSDAVLIQVGRAVVGFRKPLRVRELRVVRERGFVELVLGDGRVIRLYSKNVDALADALRRLAE